MTKQSKNRVKLNKQYRKIGTIPKSAIVKIGKFFEMFFDKNENFWLIKSIHSARLKQLEKMELVWEK